MALLRLFKGQLPGQPNPVEDTTRPAVPDPDPRNLSFAIINRILAGFSDQGGWFKRGKGGRRPHSLARARAHVLAHTPIRPEEMTRILRSD